MNSKQKKKTKISAPRKKTSRPIKGISASPGISIGQAFVLEKVHFTLPRYWVNNKEVQPEITRFLRALDKTRSELERIKEKLCKFEAKEQIHILDAYTMILNDEMLIQNTKKTIKNEHINAEWALYKNLEKIKSAFCNIEEAYFRERTSDFDYIGERILKHLAGKTDDLFSHIPPQFHYNGS